MSYYDGKILDTLESIAKSLEKIANKQYIVNSNFRSIKENEQLKEIYGPIKSNHFFDDAGVYNFNKQSGIDKNITEC